jgi:AraC-like DNA-binding protein
MTMPHPKPRKDSDDEHEVAHAIAIHLVRHFREPYELKALCRKAGFSATHLHRLFRKAYRVPPREYLLRIRAENAWAFLVNSDATITRIAELSGFGSENNLQRAFRRMYGKSPARVREEARRMTGKS